MALLSVGGELRRIEGTRVTTLDIQKVEGTRSEYRLPWGLTVWRPVTYNPFAATTVEAGSDTGSLTAVPWMAPGAGRSVQVPAGFTELVLIRSDPGSTEAEAVVILPTSSNEADEADRAVSHAVAVTNRTWARVNDALGSFGL